MKLCAAPQTSACVTSARESCQDETLRVVTARRPEPLGTSGPLKMSRFGPWWLLQPCRSWINYPPSLFKLPEMQK